MGNTPGVLVAGWRCSIVFEQDVHADVRLCDELRLHPPFLWRRRECILNVCALGHEAPSVSGAFVCLFFLLRCSVCPKSPLFCFSNWRQFFWSPALAPSLSCCHTTVVLLPGSLFQLILFFFCHTRERLLLSLSESYRCMACRCALAPFPLFLASHVFKILAFVFFVPIRFVFAPCSPTLPFLFLMHRKCVSSGVYQVCALRTVPDSMSQVGSGRCP